MRVQEERTLRELVQPRFTVLADTEHYMRLRDVADELLAAFLAVEDWEHPAAERYRRVRAQAPDFGENG